MLGRHGAWGEDGVAHAVDDLLVGGAEGGEDAAEVGAGGIAVTDDEVVGGQADASGHGDGGGMVEVEPGGLGEGGFVVALEDVGGAGPVGEGLIDGDGPVGGAEVAAEEDAAGAPGLVGVSGDFEDEIAIALGEGLELVPVGEAEFGDGGVGGDGGGIEGPGVRDEAQEALQEGLAEFLAPEVAEVAVPEEGEEEFFFEEGFRRGGEGEVTVACGLEGGGGGRDIGKIEQFEEAIDGITVLPVAKVLGPDVKAVRVELGGEPFHFGAVGGGFLGDDEVDTGSGAEDAGEAFAHGVVRAEERGGIGGGGFPVSLVEPGGEADAAGDGIEFGDGEAVVGEEEVRADDPGDLVTEGGIALPGDEFGRLALVEPAGDPVGGFAGDAASVEEIGGAIELEKDAAEGFDFAGEGGWERKGVQGDPPVEVGEETAGREPVADLAGAIGRFGGGRGGGLGSGHARG